MKKLLVVLALLAVAASSAHAQYIGNVGLQTVNNRFSATCTGAGQNFFPDNLGQTTHYLTIFAGTNLGGFNATIQGSQDGTNFVVISDVLTQVNSGIIAHGYYPSIRIRVTCAAAGIVTFTLGYSGESVAPGPPAGATLQMTVDKNLSVVQPANTTFTSTSFPTPFGNSSGTLAFIYSGAGPSGSTLTVNCINLVTTPGAITIGPFALQTAATVQTFSIPPSVCPLFSVTYTSGGASAQTFVLDYLFNPPGFTPNAGVGTYTHVVGTTATAAKATAGFLHTLTVNTGAAGTISIFDLPTASCTGTPATNVVAVITAVATTTETFTYDVNLNQGICVKASAAMDFTVSTN